jgi:hypothetical protein
MFHVKQWRIAMEAIRYIAIFTVGVAIIVGMAHFLLTMFHALMEYRGLL